MYPNKTNFEGEKLNTRIGEPVKGSPIFTGIERINKKLEYLREVLKPVTQSVLREEKDKTSQATELEGAITHIEDNLTDLLDSVRL